MLSNVSTVVCFRTGSHDDEQLMLHRFEPFIKEGDISNLPTYNYYIRIQAQESIEPMSGQTIVLPAEEASQEVADEVIEASRAKYAITYQKESKPNRARNRTRTMKNPTTEVAKRVARKTAARKRIATIR